MTTADAGRSEGGWRSRDCETLMAVEEIKREEVGAEKQLGTYVWTPSLCLSVDLDARVGVEGVHQQRCFYIAD